MENNSKTFLALVILDQRENCVSFEPQTFVNYGQWSKQEFDESYEFAITNGKFRQDWEKDWNSLMYQNQAGMKLILDTMIAAGLIKETSIDATSFIKPYVDVIKGFHYNGSHLNVGHTSHQSAMN